MANTQSERRQLTVGLVFFAVLMILGFYTILLTGIWKGKTRQYFVSFPRVYGLKEGDRVRAEGLDVGQVKKLRLVEKPSGEVRINAWLEVLDNVEIYKQGSEVKVTPYSPLGGRIVEIQRGYESPAGVYPTFAELEKDAKQDASKLVPITGSAEGELLQTLNALVDENKKSVNQIIKNLEIVSTKLTQPDSGVIGMMINDKGAAVKMDEMTTELRDAVASLNAILGRLERGEGVLGELTTKNGKLHDDVAGAADAAHGALVEVRSMLKRANDGKSALSVIVADEEHNGATSDVREIAHDLSLVARDVQDGRGTVGKLFKDDRLYEGASATAANLAVITSRVSSGKGAVGVIFNDEEAGKMVKSTIARLDRIAGSIDDKEGALGLIIKDQDFRDRVTKIFAEVARTVVEFRDSVEDLREQAPINAFLGTVFAAF